jgi:hypothetical protein
MQLMMSLFLNFKHLKFSHTEIDCLTYLSLVGEIKTNDFCLLMVQKNIYKHKQSARNFISELLTYDEKIILKTGDKNKEIVLNVPNVYSEGSCIINYLIGYKDA